MSLLKGWRNPFTKTLCPYCFKRFALHRAPLRQLDEGPDPVNDEKLVRFLGLNHKAMSPAIPVEAGFFGALRLDNSMLPTHDRICPECHLPLPIALARGELDSKIIAIVGDKGCGKSNYFAALVQQLNDTTVLQRVNIGIIAEDSFDPDKAVKKSSQTLWEERMGRFIRGEGLDGTNCRAVPETDRREVNSSLKTPLIYRLQIDAPMNGAGVFSAPFRSVLLVLYDSAGEDLEVRERVRLWYRYLMEADAMMFLMDPLRLPEIQRDRHAEGSDRLDKSSTVFDNLVTLFERENLGIHEQLRKPTSFVFTKSDALRRYLPDDSRILFPSRHDSGIDLDDMLHLSDEVQSHAREWGATSLIRKIQGRCSDHQFFAVSALGCQPEVGEDGFEYISHYAPIRVADPLLWLLYRMGYLKVSSP